VAGHLVQIGDQNQVGEFFMIFPPAAGLFQMN